MGILDDALDGVDDTEQRKQAFVRMQLEQKARSRATLDAMARDFARIANERRFPSEKVYGAARRAPRGWNVVVGAGEGNNYGYIVYPDGSWTNGWKVLHHSWNMFRRPTARVEAEKESFAPSYPDSTLIERVFADALRSYASRGTHH